MNIRSTMLCTVAALMTTACGDGTAPPPLVHGYDLVRVDDQPVPATLYRVDVPATTPGGAAPLCESKLLSGRLELGRGGRFTVTSSALLVCDDGRPDVETRSTSGGTYSLSADSLTLTGDPSRLDGSSTVWSGGRTRLELSLREQMPPGGTYGSGYGDFIMDLHTYVYRASR